MRLGGRAAGQATGGGTEVPGERVAALVPPPLPPKSINISPLAVRIISGVCGRTTRATTRATRSSAVYKREGMNKTLTLGYILPPSVNTNE